MDRPRIEQDILGAYGRPDVDFEPVQTIGCVIKPLSSVDRYPLVVKIPQAEMNGGTIGRLVCMYWGRAGARNGYSMNFMQMR